MLNVRFFPPLQGSSKALATVTSIIDGTGSIGAAVGPFLAGAIQGLDNIFYMLMVSDVFALIASV
jgi:OPA family glycerol-3-phosphate transporter-like MFS transporter 1/2